MSTGPARRFWRWSQRKLDARAAEVPAASGSPSAPAPALPPVESLTFDSDYAAFLRPEVDDEVKRAALKQLFRDPRFNVMDGLDTYIDDYTRADPIAPDVLADLLQRGFGAGPEAAPELPPGVAPPEAPAATATVPPAALAASPATDAGTAPPGAHEAGSTGAANAAPTRVKPTDAPQ